MVKSETDFKDIRSKIKPLLETVHKQLNYKETKKAHMQQVSF